MVERTIEGFKKAFLTAKVMAYITMSRNSAKIVKLEKLRELIEQVCALADEIAEGEL